MESVNYKYEKYFETEEQAKEVAEYFHEVLKGNPDYRETRILLNVEKTRVLLAEFSDSKTHVNVEEGGDGPILELFKVS